MLMHLVNDLRHAARRLCASPGFTAAAVATIAIGVGINTGIFSVLNAVAFRPLPVPESGEIVGLGQLVDGTERYFYGARIMFSTDEYRTYRDSARTLSGLVGFSTSYYVTLGGESPQQIAGAFVTCNYFEVLRTPLALGPSFRPGDCEQDTAAPTVVLGHDLWTTAFSADPAIVGREVVLDRQRFRVVGVAAEGMRGVDLVAVSFFVPITTQPLLNPELGALHDAKWSWLTLLGRLAPGATLEQARAELGVIAARIDQEQPPRKTTLLAEARRPVPRPGARTFVLGVGTVVMAAFGMVLLIACANVANLLLARATGRSAEIAVRLSLGASRGRIVQQLLAESAWIAALGGALGSMLAVWSFRGVVAFAMTALPRGTPELTLDTTPDARVLGYAFALTLAAGVVFGLLPALRASKRDLNTAIKGANASGRRADGRLQGTLVGVQVAVCIVLTIAAALLLRGLQATQSAEPGFRYADVAVAEIDFGGYDAARESAFRRELVERVRALPGVEATAQAALPPLSEGTMGISAGLPGQEELPPFGFNNVSADYFSLLEIPLVRGRAFTAADETDGSTVAIVTEATARRFWPGREPVGQKLELGARPNEPRREVEVVGVASDAEILSVGEVPSAYVYLPAAGTQRGLPLLVKARGDYAGTAAGVRAAVAALDPELVVRVAPLEANLDIWRRLAQVVSTLAASLGAVALVLAVVGVYGVVAYSVGRRVREIGVRIALGARRGDVVALVLRKTMRPVLVGAAIGLLAGLGVSRLLSAVLFGVSPADPAALAVALLVVLGGAVAAGVVPARRASRLDPNAVLHHE
ncbi:MAG TPA: ADOP family duplicated permease [Gammaproteobacteria bacterium]|nr:ADOP family duplicated permease [Gammaproteobacteria bacterium]